MGTRPRPETHCILCNRNVDLRTDLNTDENGRPVHEDCYVRSLSGVNSSNETAEDFDLLARVGLGNQGALASLYDRHSTLVYSVALRVCRDSASAGDTAKCLHADMAGSGEICAGAGKPRRKAWNFIEEPRNRPEATARIRRSPPEAFPESSRRSHQPSGSWPVDAEAACSRPAAARCGSSDSGDGVF